ncbi:MAG TPA: hypothetical protein DIW77_22595 [Chromatiaceae bacterium]|jgi:hypothetical protein|nr:hypothetical protein [Chromatiaceae bacterium]
MSAGVIRLMYAGREASENSGSPEGSCLMQNHETDSVGTRTGEEPSCSQAGGVGAGGMVKQGACRQVGDRRMPTGCLIGHRSRRSGKPATWRKDPREARSSQRKLVPDMQGYTRANLTAGTKQLDRGMGNCDGPLDKLVQPRNRMRENRTPGSVAGAPGNRSPYAGYF